MIPAWKRQYHWYRFWRGQKKVSILYQWYKIDTIKLPLLIPCFDTNRHFLPATRKWYSKFGMIRTTLRQLQIVWSRPMRKSGLRWTTNLRVVLIIFDLVSFFWKKYRVTATRFKTKKSILHKNENKIVSPKSITKIQRLRAGYKHVLFLPD